MRRWADSPVAHEFARSPLTLVFAAIVLAYLVAGVFGPRLAPLDPIEMQTLPRQPPSVQHWLGSDELGRDLFSRLLVSTRYALMVGFVAVGIGALVGGLLGVVAGFFGGVVDSVSMRFVDVLLAFPGILLALAVISILGPGLTNTMIAIGIAGIPGFARLMRGETLALLERDYVLAARNLGASSLRVMALHIMPLAIPSLLVYSTTQLATAILAEAGLSYLGLGVQPPFPSWGAMIAGGQRYFLDAPFMAIFPGLAIMILVFALNIVGDGLRDALNPQLRRGLGSGGS